MSKSLLLDTHIWIWYVMGNMELTQTSQELITQSLEHRCAYLAAISLWEISMLSKRERIILDMPCLSWINRFLTLTPVQIIPLSAEIAVDSCHLPGDFHGDPADRLITASARVEQLTIITRDEKILSYAQFAFVSAIKG